jgi:predicted transcriptional regulator
MRVDSLNKIVDESGRVYRLIPEDELIRLLKAVTPSAESSWDRKSETFGAFLKRKIREIKTSQKLLAHAAGMTEATVSNIIRGKQDPHLPTINTLIATLDSLS